MPNPKLKMIGDNPMTNTKKSVVNNTPERNLLKKQLSEISHRSASPRTSFVGNKPALLEKGPLRFVITDSPSDSTISNHLADLKMLKVKHVCRASEPTYSAEPLRKSGIEVHDLVFKDGDPPPESVIRKWLKLVEQCFIKHFKGAKVQNVNGEILAEHLKNDERISVHCVAGLGRAPVLVAVALLEFCKIDALDAVQFIREHRRGAINKKQFKWLEEYIPRTKRPCGACACVVS